MAFREDARDNYTEAGILRSAPVSEGVYGIYVSGNRFIYIGRSDNMEQRLLEHVRGDSNQSWCINQYNPDMFVCERTTRLRKARTRADTGVQSGLQ